MRSLVRKIIIWALGAEPLVKRPDPKHDAAGLDKVISGIK